MSDTFKQQFERGDVVIYDCTGQKQMKQWEILNGCLGVVTSSAKIDRAYEEPKLVYEINWITKVDLHPGAGAYPEYLLRKIGHIDADKI